jgi:hypothetical protein
LRAVAILNICGMDAYAEQEAECVDEDVALAARDLLARIKPCGSSAGPLFALPCCFGSR